MWLLVIVIWLLFGIASIAIARSKGRNGCAWFLGYFLLGPLGLIIIAVLPRIEKKMGKRKEKESQSIPYANFRRVTKTGKVQATKYDKEEGRFKIGKEVYGVEDISKNAKKVYLYLARVADSKGYCFPFIKTIATRCNISSSTVNKVLKELEGKGLIRKLARRVSRRGGSSNIYQVLIRE